MFPFLVVGIYGLDDSSNEIGFLALAVVSGQLFPIASSVGFLSGTGKAFSESVHPLCQHGEATNEHSHETV